jgi:predicted regulator of amino acid metabolism with ACT domain
VKYRNILETTRLIFKEEGVKGFFKGVQMRMAIQSVSSGIGWGTYQLVKGLMSKSQY